jgi:hypothetical protein
MIKRTTSVVGLTLSVALSLFAGSTRPHLSREEVIRIAQAKIAHDFAGSPWHYQRAAVWYLADDRTWIVSYREKTSRSRCTVQVNDRTRRTLTLMP